MAITAANIKLLASQVMDDIEQGGGAPTSTAIVDGASNSIFEDISELDRAGGRVNLRKVFASVQTAGTETYLGGNIIVADTPDDPNVSVTIFSTADVFDRRSAASSRVESYLAAGASWDGYLWENHIAGMRSIQIFQRPTAQAPIVGQTLVLVENENKSNEKRQYVRATKVSIENRTFTEIIGSNLTDYPAAVVIVEISDPLRTDFTGSPASRLFKSLAASTIIRDTVVADAGTYCGAVPTTQAVEIGDLSVKVGSIYTQLVPSAQTEIPLIDKTLASDAGPIIAAGGSHTFVANGISIAVGTVLRLPRGIMPGSLNGTGFGLTDDGNGNIIRSGAIVGTADYGQGLLTFTSAIGSGNFSASYTPAVAVFDKAHSFARDVTAENRGYTWVIPLSPLPAPNTVEVAYMVAGRWISLRDNGNGTLTASDAAFGTGTVSYTTGTLALTTGALPDVGSSIIANWGSSAVYEIKAGATQDVDTSGLSKTWTLPNVPVLPQSVVISWLQAGVTKTATTTSEGVISGNGLSGTVDRVFGRIFVTFGTIPDANTSVSIQYSKTEFLDDITGDPAAPAQTEMTVSLGMLGGFSLARSIPAGGFRAIGLHRWGALKGDIYLKDNGAGSIVVESGIVAFNADSVDISGATVGTIDYATGIGSFSDNTITVPWKGFRPTHAENGFVTGYAEYTENTSFGLFDDNNVRQMSVRIIESIADIVGASEEHSPQPDVVIPLGTDGVNIRLLSTNYRQIVPGSVIFTALGKTYYDRAGKLYIDPSITTGAATEVGSINYSDGTVNLTAWANGQAFTPTVISLLTKIGTWSAASIALRTPAAPLRPSSMTFSVTDADGIQRTGTSNADGDIIGTGLTGKINYQTGVVTMSFGEFVAGEYQGFLVDLSTARYNAVAYSYLPLDASVLGIDPVRLPSDGRVPIFRAGSFAVLGHTDRTTPATVSNGQTIDCGRVRLSRVRVLDDNDQIISNGYTHNLDAGTVTFTDVAGYAQPITVEHRIEDMAMISDAQINGDIKFTRQITHNYPVGSVLSSALVTGDLRARVTVTFDQQTWGNVWSDAVIGNNASATFNDAAYPIQVTNAGALTERWAVVFLTISTFNVIGEHVGVVATGNTANDCAPINPATGAPYFTLPALGWGAGWASGNVLRFNTVGAFFPVWVVRTIQQGQETITDDAFTLLIRGDVDRP
jgi:hypothetical protein